MVKKPEVVVLNKIDALTPEEVEVKLKDLSKACGKKVFAMSAVSRQGIYDCLNEVNQYITRDRLQQNHKEVEEKERGGEVKTWSPI